MSRGATCRDCPPREGVGVSTVRVRATACAPRTRPVSGRKRRERSVPRAAGAGRRVSASGRKGRVSVAAAYRRVAGRVCGWVVVASQLIASNRERGSPAGRWQCVCSEGPVAYPKVLPELHVWSCEVQQQEFVIIAAASLHID